MIFCVRNNNRDFFCINGKLWKRNNNSCRCFILIFVKKNGNLFLIYFFIKSIIFFN